jgi:ribonuclease HI
MAKKKQPKWYVVWHGRQPGIYTSWAECCSQVHGYAAGRYKSFESLAEAQAAYAASSDMSIGVKPPIRELLFKKTDAVSPSLAVDAACSGNPGAMEYRGVWFPTGEEAFRSAVFEEGTNNLGEFLALVDGLKLLREQQINVPLYSDSRTAIGWLNKKKVNTTLIPNDRNQALFAAIDRAQQWLREYPYDTEILKWDTQAWGQIPADFGRK